MEIFFTSDSHYSHANIIKYCNRPFESVVEMNGTLINAWNEMVGMNDTIYHLGDFFFNKSGNVLDYIEALNGNIILVRGNHDHSKTVKELKQHPRVTVFEGFIDIKVDDDEMDSGYQMLTLCHYPMLAWNQSHRGAWQLFGHLHGTAEYYESHKERFSPNQLDVGVDRHNYRPISYMEVKEIITKQNLTR
jgi:calcineurin-like phosphoesterase family protein